MQCRDFGSVLCDFFNFIFTVCSAGLEFTFFRF